MEKAGDDEENFCPLCMEEMDSTDKQLKPCKCGYEVCVWCWHHVMQMAEKDNTEGRCPACRMPYNKEKIVGMSVSCQRQTDVDSEKKQRAYKLKAKIAQERNNLNNVRVIQRNLVYVGGVPASLADEKNLKRREFFGQYGEIIKVSISRSRSRSARDYVTGSTVSVYITFVKEEDATFCIHAVDGYILGGSPLRACYGATKYCYSWLKNVPCNKPDCLYLHDLGIEEDTFTKEEMSSKCIRKIKKFQSLTCSSQQRSGHCLPPPAAEGGQAKIALTIETIGKSTVLPANASWGFHTTHEKLLPVRTRTVQGSTNPKSFASHSSSRSPPPNLRTAIAAVAPVVSDLTTDHIKPCSRNRGGRRLSSCKSGKLSTGKHNVVSVRNKGLDALGKGSHSVATSQVVNSGQATQGSVTGLINLDSKSETHDGLENPVTNRTCNFQQGPSNPGTLYVDKMAKSKRTDAACVSCGIVCGSPKTALSVSVPHINNEATVLEVNETTVFISSHENKNDKSFDQSFPCVDFSEDNDKHSPERSFVESRNNYSIKIPVDARHPDNYKEQSENSLAKHGQKLRDYMEFSENNFLDSQVPLCMDGVLVLADSLMSKEGASSSVEDQSLIFNSKLLNNVICHGNHDNTGCSCHEVEEKSVPHLKDSTVDSVKYVTSKSVSDLMHRSPKSNIQMATVLDIAKISEGSSDKLDCSYGLGHDMIPELTKGVLDGGDNSIISNILSLNSPYSEGISLPSHNLARLLLADTDKPNVSSNDISSFWMLQKSNQSRFLFARSEDYRETSIHSSTPYLISSSELQLDSSNGKDILETRNDYDQINRVSCHSSVPKMEGSQTNSEGSIFCTPSEAPGEAPSVPPGLVSQAIAKIPVEHAFVYPKNDFEEVACLSKMSSNACSQPYLLNTGAFDDVEFIDPAIMAVGKGKLPARSNCSASGNHGSHCSGFLPPSASNDNCSHSFFGSGPHLMLQPNQLDFGRRLEMPKQRTFFINSNLVSSRHQFMFADQVEDISTSYLPSQKDDISCKMVEHTQPNLNARFSQLPSHQPANALFTSPLAGTNGWNNWNMVSSVVEPGLVVGQPALSLAGIMNVERNDLMDPKTGLMMFPSYNGYMFYKPSFGSIYSQTYM